MSGLDWTKVAGVLAIGLGVALLWVPPAALAHDASLSIAIALIVGGFGALGVSIAPSIAAARARGEREAAIRANRSAGARRGAETRRRARSGSQEPLERP